MKKAITFMLTLVISVVGMTMHAQAPQTGVYRIQNVGGQKYVKVTGKYDATLVASQQDASYIQVGIEKKLSDGTYKVNSLASTYGSENTPVEVYDYIPKALTLGEAELRKILKNSSDENVKKAIARMHELAEQYAFMRLMPVDGQADTYHAIAVLPYIPKDVVDAWDAKVDYNGTMWQWCKDLVINYLNEHSGAGGTDATLAARIRNNLAKINEGHTYMLTVDPDGSFGYYETGANFKGSDEENWETTVNTATLKNDDNSSYWKLTPKVNTDNVKDGTYKIRNLGTKKYVSIKSKYYAKPDAEEANASDIRITFNGEANGGQKIVNLGGTAPDGTDIDIYSYIEKAILIGKMAIYDVLNQENPEQGVNPANDENIAIAQEYMENFVKDNAFMCMKPVPDKDDAVYAYAFVPQIPEEVVYQMYRHHAITANDPALAWAYGVAKVKAYLSEHSGAGGTNSTLASYILANIDKIRPGVTYYLSAHPSDGTFDYAPETATETQAAANLNDEHFMWGFDVEEVEEDNLTSGTYKVRNVDTGDYVEVLSKYYAKPDTDEENATEIHITYNGKLDDGSYKVTNMSAVAKDGSQCDIADYIQKAIKVARVAIADVLKGEDPNAHVASDENIAYAQQYLEDFVNENAYMRVKPVAGTNYVYAIATIPEIPDEVVTQMYNHGVITEKTKEAAWQYGVDYVMNHLEGHNSTLVQLIRANLPKIKQGHTYYLSEDDNQTFGYVDTEDPNFSLSNKRLQWGIDLEEEDQPVESDFYKIHNVGNDLYVKVQGRYYAAPDADEASATPIAVTIDGMLEDGSMKVTNLVGDGHDIQKYVDHAIEIGTTLIHNILDSQSSDENIQRAIEEMTNFVKENAYMRVKLVPGETEAYYAYVVLPTVPQYIVDEWEKKFPGYNGTMRDWAVQKVKDYLTAHPQVDGKLASMIRNNIDKLYEGHTYYLRADGDNTFGIGDFTTGEVTLTDQHYWWGFADAIKAEPFSGYYRIKGADGKYVNVTGKFAAAPNADAATAKTAAGSVIYVGTGETKNTKTLPLEILRSQGVDVGSKSESAYMNMINDVLLFVAGKISEIATAKIQENPKYSQYAGLVEPMIQTLVESVDLNLYVEPTITSDGKNAYMLEVNIPDLKEYCSLAQDALSLMGKQGEDLVDNLEAMKNNDGGIMDKLIDAAIEMAVMLDHGNDAADEIWAMLKRKGNTFLNDPYYYNKLVAMIPEQALTFIKNALNNPDFNYGTTYCLRQDADGTFGYASRESLIDSDNAKWILEPFDEQDPNYNEETYMPFVVNTEFEQQTYIKVEGAEGIQEGETYNYTTTYLDFDAKIETQNAVAYTISATERKDFTKNDGTVKVYYLATLNPIAQYEGTIPAATPVVLRSDNDGEIELRPINKPEHKATESGEFETIKLQLIAILGEKLSGYTTQNAPSPKAISNAAGDENSILVGSFFGDEIDAMDANTYLPLTTETKRETGSPALDMEGLGFWKENISKLEGNKAYMNGDGQTEFKTNTTLSNATVGNAPGYILQYDPTDEGAIVIPTAIETVSKEVKSIRYYNAIGVESTTPFEGVNIIVTTFTDGTQATTKVIK